MNIALLPSAFHPSLGGVEELTAQLGRALQHLGHEVIVITNRWPRDLPERETVGGLEVHRLPMRYPGACWKSWASFYATRHSIRSELFDILRDRRIELMHVQCVSAQAAYAIWAKRSLGLPLIVTLQGELTMDATGLYQRSQRARAMMRMVLNGADAVTACSGQTLDEAKQFMGSAWNVPSGVIWNGVNAEEIMSAVPHSHSKPYIFAIGRHVPQKGFDVLLRAFALARERGCEFDLVLAGDGPERGALEQLTTQLELDSFVHFTGRTVRVETASLFRGCEFFVLASRHEPFGIVILEAMAAGKAVIATRVGGVPEIVRDIENGLLVTPSDPAALAEAIMRMSRDSPLTRRLEASGQNAARTYSWTRIAAHYVEQYQRLAASR